MAKNTGHMHNTINKNHLHVAGTGTLTYPGSLGTRGHSASRLFSLSVLHYRHYGFHPSCVNM